MKRILLLLCLMSALSACVPSPEAEARALAIKIAAEQKALSDAQTRQIAATQNALDVREQERIQDIADAGVDGVKNGVQTFGFWVVAAIAVAIIYFVLSAGKSAGDTTYDLGQAAVDAADLKAHQIYLDKETGQYPVLIQSIGNGRFTATDFNVGETWELDMSHPADQLMVRNSGAVRYAGVISRNASQSRDPEGVASVRPLILDGEFADEDAPRYMTRRRNP